MTDQFEIKKLHDQGLSERAIAKQTGLPKTTVHRRLQELKTEIVKVEPMTTQLSLFKVTAPQLEQMSMLIATLDGEIIALREELKDAQAELRESTVALEVKDIRAQIKDATDRLAKATAGLRAASREE